MCGEDGTQMVVYKLKEEHAKGDRNKKKKKRKKQNIDNRRTKREKRTVSITKENDRCASSEPLIYVRENLFIIEKLT